MFSESVVANGGGRWWAWPYVWGPLYYDGLFPSKWNKELGLIKFVPS